MVRKKKTEEKEVVNIDKIPVQSSQPALSLGLVGHVDHGKTTLVQSLSGKWTDTHSEEIKRGITIRLGYADVEIYKCRQCKELPYTLTKKCSKCSEEAEFSRKISLVDAPGHESLMATMLCGANIMDGALLLISANEECPQPQTQEHLMALEIVGIKKVIVVQNKVDLVTEEEALKNYKQIKEFLKGSKYEDAPIIPISAFHKINIDALLEAIEQTIPTPQRDTTKDPLMFVARSFDINKPGTKPENLVGGILGGVLHEGMLKTGQEIEIVPGYETEVKHQKVWNSVKTSIVKIIAGGKEVEEVRPGGSFAIQTALDPSVVKADSLVGSIVGLNGKLPSTYNELMLKVSLLQRMVGAKENLVVEPIKLKEFLMMNVYSSATVGLVSEVGKDKIKCSLKRPVSAKKGARVSISRRTGQRWRLIGYAEIM